jgi:hypothetical protein
MATRIQIRRDTSTNWEANNPVLALGEPGLETDTFIVKYGDGSTAWNSLPYANIDSLADFTTNDLTEGSRLYYSNARVYANILTLAHATNAQLATYATNAQLALYATNAQLVANATTANVTEVTNLYFTNARSYANILSLGFATNNQLSLYATGGQLTLYATNAQLALYATNAQLVANATTANVTEVTNLYFTNARAIGAFTAGSGMSIAANGLLVSTVTGNVSSNVITVAGASGEVSNVQLAAGISSSGILTTANVSEVTNLYYSNARVSANVATLGYAANTFVVNQLSQIYYPAVARLSVTNIGASNYNFYSHYSSNNPNVYTISGTTISFALDVTGHPFLLQENSGSGFNNIASSTQLFHLSPTGVLTTGSSAQGQVAGTLYWNVPFGTTNVYQYRCSIHSNMVGNVIVKDISVI